MKENKKLTVEIVKCTNCEFWYCDQINKVFEVYDAFEVFNKADVVYNHYVIAKEFDDPVSKYTNSYSTILKSDCRIVE